MLSELIAQASKMVGGALEADKRNNDHNYHYVSADKILSVCGQALAACKVVIFPEIDEESVQVSEYIKGNGKTGQKILARVVFKFHVVAEKESLIFRWVGFGVDYTNEDKAIAKAVTMGHRYFIAKLLNVGMGNEDGEHENAEQEEPRQSMTLESALALKTTRGTLLKDLTTEQLNQIKNIPNVSPVYIQAASIIIASRANEKEKPHD